MFFSLPVLPSSSRQKKEKATSLSYSPSHSDDPVFLIHFTLGTFKGTQSDRLHQRLNMSSYFLACFSYSCFSCFCVWRYRLCFIRDIISIIIVIFIPLLIRISRSSAFQFDRFESLPNSYHRILSSLFVFRPLIIHPTSISVYLLLFILFVHRIINIFSFISRHWDELHWPLTQPKQ